MSRTAKFAILIVLVTNLCSCSSGSENMHEKIHSKFYDMPSYTAKCSMTVSSNKTKNEYDFTCTYDSAGERYRIDYPDSSVILTDTDARIVRGDLIANVPPKDSDMLMFVNTFFKSYYVGESASIDVSANTDSGYTLLEAELVNPTKFGHFAKLWIRNKDVSPHNMKVYDKDGNETLAVIFENFEITKAIEQEKFTQ